MANNKTFKIKNGLLAGRYLQSNGTETAVSERYDLAGASYDSISFSTNTQITTGSNYDVAFSSDGSIMYANAFNMSTVFQYSLSSPWNISTASYSSKSYNYSSTVSSVFAIDFSTDGTNLYLLGQDADTVYQFNLSTAWDLSTSSYASKSYAVSQDNSNEALKFNSDGTKLYTGGSATDTIYQHSLSTAWDLSTASYTSTSFSASSQDTRVRSLDFNSTGTKMYICGADTDTVYQYSLSTASDLSTASYDNINFSVASQETNPYGFCFGKNGLKMYLSGTSSDVIYQYTTGINSNTLDLSTGNTFSITPTEALDVLFTNPPASGTAVGFTLEVNNTGGYALTWPSSVKWHLGTAPTATASKELYTFVTTDGGTTYYGKLAGSNIA